MAKQFKCDMNNSEAERLDAICVKLGFKRRSHVLRYLLVRFLDAVDHNKERYTEESEEQEVGGIDFEQIDEVVTKETLKKRKWQFGK